MSLLRELAARDLVDISTRAVTVAIISSVHTTFCAVTMICASQFSCWHYELPTEMAVDWYPYALLAHATMFLHFGEFQKWVSDIITLIKRDAPPDGLPGAEIVNAIVQSLLLLLYIIVSFLLYNIWTILAFLYRHKVWVASLLASLPTSLLLVRNIRRRFSLGSYTRLQAGSKPIFGLLQTLLITIRRATYDVPLLAIELCRSKSAHFITTLRPLLELHGLRRPSTLFSYQDLSAEKKEIRLIQLDRRFPGADISCRFVHFPVGEAPQYEAISYTWGLGGKTHLIFLEGSWLPVTRNVHKILHDRSSYIRTRLVWIDAVCINQENLDEKSWQVEMMGEIYQAAERVVIWLDDQHIRHSEMMDATLLLEAINFMSLDLPTDVYDPPSRVVGHCNHWKALSRLLSHPYWRRVWIIQEVAMAKNVHLLYGNRYIAWDHLVKMVTCLVTYPVRVLPAVAHVTYGLENSTFSSGTIQVLAIATLRDLVHRNEFTTLVKCILFTQRSNATNPRDKIFALKNLVRQPSDSKLVPSIEIDYRLKVHDVYANVSRDLLKTTPSFILSFAGIGWQRKTPGLPSWVPDFQSLPECTDEQNLNADARYSAGLPGSIDIPVDAVFNGYLPTITVQAIPVSNVSCISPTKITIGETQTMSDSFIFTKTLYTEAWKLVQKMPSRYAATGQATVEAFWRTLIGDRHVIEGTTNTQFKRPASPEYGTYFLARQDEFFTGEDLTTDMAWMKEATRNKTDEFKYKSSFNFSRAIGCVWQGRKFAVTENGLMGVVPPGAKLGDVLCVVPGFERPVLLRKSPRQVLLRGEDDDTYEFVGACYAHGIMDGELLKRMPSFKTFRVR